MSLTPDSSLSIKSIIEANWSACAGGIAIPTITTPAETKRFAFKGKPVIHIYSVAAIDTKRGLSNAYRDRVDTCSIEITTADGIGNLNDLLRITETILDLTTVRSSPTTRPAVATYADSYTANPYDQIIPVHHTKMEDRNRQWWQVVIDVECRSYWEAR